MAWTGSQYADAEEFRALAGQGKASDANLDILLKAASDKIDQQTATWFDSRAATFEITVPVETRFIWLPAPIITLTTVTEVTSELTEITEPNGSGEFYAYKSKGKLEKMSAWSSTPKSIIVVGTFGYEDESHIEDRIKTLCIWLAASIGDYRKRTYENEDGDIAEVPVSKFPAWIIGEFAALRFRRSRGLVIETTWT